MTAKTICDAELWFEEIVRQLISIRSREADVPELWRGLSKRDANLVIGIPLVADVNHPAFLGFF